MAEEKRKTWRGFFFKLGVFIALFVGVILTVMSFLGGSGETYREGIESFAAKTFGYPAELETLNIIRFYPDFIVDLEGLKLFTEEGSQETVMEVGKVQLATGFWDLAFQNGIFKTFNIENLRADPGVLLPKSVTIDSLAIKTPKDEDPVFKGAGTVGEAPWSVSMELNVVGTGAEIEYKFAERRRFTVKLGDIHASGVMINNSSNELRIENILVSAPDPLLTGDLRFQNDGGQKTKIQGKLKLAQEVDPEDKKETILKPDLVVELEQDKVLVSGKAVFAPLYTQDFDRLVRAAELPGRIAATLKGPGDDRIDLTGLNLDLNVEFKSMAARHADIGFFNVAITAENGDLTIDPGGTFSGGEIQGQADLRTGEEGPAKLDLDLRIAKLDYGLLQLALAGQGDFEGTSEIHVNLQGNGETWTQLKKNLSGHASWVAGQGKFPVAMLNLWGGGLLNAMLPKFDQSDATTLNCAVADFEVKNGIAEATAIIIETQQVSITGTGTYSIPDNSLDLRMKPDPKGVAVIDVSNAVNVTGPLGDPSISAGKFDLGKTLGGLFLGTINPAFYALTLADLGIGSDNPCYQYFKAGETAQEE